MTNMKKKVLAVSLVISIIAILSMGTLAWFNDSDEVTNKFMMATSSDDPDEIFSVDLWETKTNPDGTPVVPNEKTDDGNTYTNIAPGAVLTKDPTVENTGSYDQWVRVEVVLNKAQAWINTLGQNYDLADIFGGHDETVWTRYEAGKFDATQNTFTMVYYLNQKLAPGATATLFETVTIPAHLDQNDMARLGGSFDLKIKAEALQYDNLPAANCYDAFANYWN